MRKRVGNHATALPPAPWAGAGMPAMSSDRLKELLLRLHALGAEARRRELDHLSAEVPALAAELMSLLAHDAAPRRSWTPGAGHFAGHVRGRQVNVAGHLGPRGWPVDIECGFHRGDLHLFQCRPITTLR